MLIERPPAIFRILFPDHCLFRAKAESGKRAFLTFDDGPIPEITPLVLDILDRFRVKATFFVVGDNARRHPDLIREIRRRGHSIGNHTMHHLKGAATNTPDYLADIRQARDYIGDTRLFRPPHGWLTRKQAHLLQPDYRIVLYDLVTRDYSKKTSAEDVVANVRKFARNGSVIVFHDSLKSAQKIPYALPEAIRWLQENDYRLEPIPESGII